MFKVTFRIKPWVVSREDGIPDRTKFSGDGVGEGEEVGVGVGVGDWEGEGVGVGD